MAAVPVSPGDFKKGIEWLRACGRGIKHAWEWRRRLRMKLLAGHYRHMHLGVVHRLRELTTAMEAESDMNVCGERALTMCEEFCIGMRNVLQLKETELHCCIKMYQPTADGDSQLATWVSHGPNPRRKRTHTAVDPATSTIWAALNEGFDGTTHWRRFPCFCSNNLEKFASTFKCARPDWPNHYKATLVFPVRLMTAPNKLDPQAVDVGYVAFDSLKVGAFWGLPEIFDFRDKPDQYLALMKAQAAFHLGAIYADLWGTCLVSLHDPSQCYQGEAHAGPRNPAQSAGASDSTVKRPPGDNPGSSHYF